MRRPSRRQILLTASAAAVSLPHILEATPDLPDTDPEGDGPFYKPGAPLRSDFREPGIAGPEFQLHGQVFDTTGKALAGAVLDIWHADGNGEYDNVGWKLRGRLRADEAGRYSLRSVRPRWYGDRAAHFHVKVSAAGHPQLTTALYFEGDPKIPKDTVIRTKLRIKVAKEAAGESGKFDFVLRIS